MKRKLSILLATSLITSSFSGISVFAQTSNEVSFEQNFQSETRVSGVVTSVNGNTITLETSSEVIEIDLEDDTLVTNFGFFRNGEAPSEDVASRPEPSEDAASRPEPHRERKNPPLTQNNDSEPEEKPESTEEVPNFHVGRRPGAQTSPNSESEVSENEVEGERSEFEKLSISDITVGSIVEIIFDSENNVREVKIQVEEESVNVKSIEEETESTEESEEIVEESTEESEEIVEESTEESEESVEEIVE